MTAITHPICNTNNLAENLVGLEVSKMVVRDFPDKITAIQLPCNFLIFQNQPVTHVVQSDSAVVKVVGPSE